MLSNILFFIIKHANEIYDKQNRSSLLLQLLKKAFFRSAHMSLMAKDKNPAKELFSP